MLDKLDSNKALANCTRDVYPHIQYPAFLRNEKLIGAAGTQYAYELHQELVSKSAAAAAAAVAAAGGSVHVSVSSSSSSVQSSVLDGVGAAQPPPPPQPARLLPNLNTDWSVGVSAFRSMRGNRNALPSMQPNRSTLVPGTTADSPGVQYDLYFSVPFSFYKQNPQHLLDLKTETAEEVAVATMVSFVLKARSLLAVGVDERRRLNEEYNDLSDAEFFHQGKVYYRMRVFVETVLANNKYNNILELDPETKKETEWYHMPEPVQMQKLLSPENKAVLRFRWVIFDPSLHPGTQDKWLIWHNKHEKNMLSCPEELFFHLKNHTFNDTCKEWLEKARKEAQEKQNEKERQRVEKRHQAAAAAAAPAAAAASAAPSGVAGEAAADVPPAAASAGAGAPDSRRNDEASRDSDQESNSSSSENDEDEEEEERRIAAAHPEAEEDEPGQEKYLDDAGGLDDAEDNGKRKNRGAKALSREDVESTRNFGKDPYAGIRAELGSRSTEPDARTFYRLVLSYQHYSKMVVHTYHMLARSRLADLYPSGIYDPNPMRMKDANYDFHSSSSKLNYTHTFNFDMSVQVARYYVPGRPNTVMPINAIQSSKHYYQGMLREDPKNSSHEIKPIGVGVPALTYEYDIQKMEPEVLSMYRMPNAKSQLDAQIDLDTYRIIQHKQRLNDIRLKDTTEFKRYLNQATKIFDSEAGISSSSSASSSSSSSTLATALSERGAASGSSSVDLRTAINRSMSARAGPNHFGGKVVQASILPSSYGQLSAQEQMACDLRKIAAKALHDSQLVQDKTYNGTLWSSVDNDKFHIAPEAAAASSSSSSSSSNKRKADSDKKAADAEKHAVATQRLDALERAKKRRHMDSKAQEKLEQTIKRAKEAADKDNGRQFCEILDEVYSRSTDEERRLYDAILQSSATPLSPSLMDELGLQRRGDEALSSFASSLNDDGEGGDAEGSSTSSGVHRRQLAEAKAKLATVIIEGPLAKLRKVMTRKRLAIIRVVSAYPLKTETAHLAEWLEGRGIRAPRSTDEEKLQFLLRTNEQLRRQGAAAALTSSTDRAVETERVRAFVKQHMTEDLKKAYDEEYANRLKEFVLTQMTADVEEDYRRDKLTRLMEIFRSEAASAALSTLTLSNRDRLAETYLGTVIHMAERPNQEYFNMAFSFDTSLSPFANAMARDLMQMDTICNVGSNGLILLQLCASFRINAARHAKQMSQNLIVQGEPGIGKSHLFEYYQQMCTSASVVSSQYESRLSAVVSKAQDYLQLYVTGHIVVVVVVVAVF